MRHRDDVNLGKLGALQDALDRLQRRRALRATTRRLGIYIAEQGYQTELPDRFAGGSRTGRICWLQQAAYLAWRSPRVKLLTQYLCRDEPASGDGSYGGWQSGPGYARGRAKPSLAHELGVERRLRGGSWRTSRTSSTDARGYWTLRRRVSPGAAYRYRVDRTTSAVRRR